ncbi:serine hydrolase domain-containing protein [Flavihumibacter fluvii]|uniref:serine hydrolase domain-containing protein n=1 Tax=Flavihumibacter fluvii TaxID=2838157 RepID=UPI001BDEC5AE|nr:serine hydrolase domain-containing protein [Flavihumibacter fluvii]ULQ50878.1 beta-lactamase family protein [Flavihumibacter fluvii]
MYKKFIAPILASFLVLLNVQTVTAQAIPDSITNRIDSLFGKWTLGNSPGCAVGIVRNDSLIFAKGYGKANLEYGIFNTPGTLFHMASISKQFAGWSMILLAKQGKLKLDDDVRKYLPWFPDLKHKITIQHLLNHTSGIRDQWQLLAISGTRLDDVITQAHVVKILSQQRALNFTPGEEYSYSNSGFTMLAEIVKSVTGQTLRQFTDSAIFKPLGMASTHFHDDNSEIERGRAYSYNRKDSAHFSNAILSYSVAGATSLFTTVNDMSRWAMNFYSHHSGDQRDIDLLTHQGKLNSGKLLDYANGIAVGKHNGWREFSHGGADAGFRTYLTVFPDNKMAFMVFSNLGDFDPGGMAYAIADLFIKDSSLKKVEKKAPRDSAAAVLKNPAVWKKFLGDYIGNDGLPFNFYVKGNSLYYRVFDETNFLIPEQKDTFSIPAAPEIKFRFSIKGKDTLADVFTPSKTYHVKKYIVDSLRSDAFLKAYTGKYYSKELDCSYSIILKNHHLYLTNAKYDDARLNLIGTEHLTNENWWINHVKMIRDSNKTIKGFEVNSGRIQHLRFDKIK